MAKKTYVFMLSEKDRKRHEHISEKGRIIRFMVQYEIYLDGKWCPVVRYDNAHGYAHKDLISPDGSKKKVFLGEADFNEALTMADGDINDNWQLYKDSYLRRRNK